MCKHCAAGVGLPEMEHMTKSRHKSKNVIDSDTCGNCKKTGIGTGGGVKD